MKQEAKSASARLSSARLLLPAKLNTMILRLREAIAAVCLAIVCVSAAPIAHAGDQLTPKSFKSRIREGYALVEWYSPYCVRR